MYTLEKLGALTSARKLVHAWGTAYYEVTVEGCDPVLIKLDGQDIVKAAVRWTELVESVRGRSAANSFGAAATDYLTAQTALGQADRSAGAQRSYEAGVAVGRAQIRLEVAEAALQIAARPRAQ